MPRYLSNIRSGRGKASIPTQTKKTHAHARFPQAHADQRRTQSHRRPPPARTQTAQRGAHPLGSQTEITVKRSFSLRRDDFQSVWDDGKSWSHPLVILRASANGMSQCRFGFVAGKKVGKAVTRNRAKRWLREAARHRLPTIVPGWDIILIARSGIAQTEFKDIDAAIETLLQRAQLISTL